MPTRFAVRPEDPSFRNDFLEKPLSECLDDGLRPADWLRLLNGRVYLWIDAEDRKRFLERYRSVPQEVITFDTRRLLERLSSKVELSSTGNTRRRPARRGLKTFQPFVVYWARTTKPPVEFTIRDGISEMELLKVVTRVETHQDGTEPEAIWP
jgi:hypothetical protein